MTTAETKHTSHSSNTLDEAAERALDYYLNPKPTDEAPGKTPTAQLFMVSPDIDTETLLANASEDLLSIAPSPPTWLTTSTARVAV
ncbi:hypothetical protein PflQ2_5522 [Pseudomonas fluorescens Q2-87]|uniref:Uncharacterized protein n=1 Tax=Pseudomonas fluorescens (strain Q2-87) TaxID=1038922 RepID=J2ES91_PSEFQ|nr:hypothetical protein PflQ2_5522 [Pseudomonas fluorescens Q2-87]